VLLILLILLLNNALLLMIPFKMFSVLSTDQLKLVPLLDPLSFAKIIGNKSTDLSTLPKVILLVGLLIHPLDSTVTDTMPLVPAELTFSVL